MRERENNPNTYQNIQLQTISPRACLLQCYETSKSRRVIHAIKECKKTVNQFYAKNNNIQKLQLRFVFYNNSVSSPLNVGNKNISLAERNYTKLKRIWFAWTNSRSFSVVFKTLKTTQDRGWKVDGWSTFLPPLFVPFFRMCVSRTENRISYKGYKMETAFKLQSWRLSLRVLFVC